MQESAEERQRVERYMFPVDGRGGCRRVVLDEYLDGHVRQQCASDESACDGCHGEWEMPIPGMPCSVAGSPRDRWPVASHDGQRVQSPARQVISPGPQVQPARQMACPGPQIESPARQTASPGPQDQSARQMACPGPQIQSPARQVMTPRPQIQSPAQQMPTQQIMPPRPQDQSAQ